MQNKLTVVIPTYNNINGLNYLLTYLMDKLFNVIVVDNKPTKEKQLSVRSYGLGGRLLYLPQKVNLGFAKAVNLGAKHIKTKWMLILNDDIEFKKKNPNDKIQMTNKLQMLNFKNKNRETIERLIQFAEKSKLEAVSPVLRNPDGRVENYGYKVLSYGKVKLVREIPRLASLARNDRGGVKEIDGLTAACLLTKTKVFKKLKGFDESFFAYLEDVDFFLRFKKEGCKMGIASDIEVLHNHMTTTKTMGNFKAKQDMINWWRLYFKHPDIFNFNLKFIMERLRNVSGYLKKTLKIIK